MKFTMVAGQAMDFATRFNAFFAAGLSGPVQHKLDLTTPVGPSTAGGKQVVQHVRLLPADGGLAIVIGSVNGIEKTAEIRSLQALAELHARRFKGAALPIDPAAYQALARSFQEFFVNQGFTLTMTQAESPMAAPSTAAHAPRASTSGAVVAIVAVMLLAVAGIAIAWLRYQHLL